MNLRRRTDEFHAVLIDAQRARRYLPMHFNGTDVDPYWNHYEMLTMLKHVNMSRESLDRPLLKWPDIARAERMASGHIDYTRKFALYCAELVDRD